MNGSKRDTSLGEGVYFAHDDYVGMMPRVVILVVDLAVLVAALIIGYGICFLISAILEDITDVLNSVFALLYLFFVWVYLTILKSSRVRTVGYRLTGCRIVNRYAGTCVVKKHAKPIGTAEIHLIYYNAMGFAFAFPRVMAPMDGRAG